MKTFTVWAVKNDDTGTIYLPTIRTDPKAALASFAELLHPGDGMARLSVVKLKIAENNE